MRAPIKWLSKYVALNLPIQEIAKRLTMAGLEVTSIDESGEDWSNIVVGHVLEVTRHPDADRLSLVTVDTGEGECQVVCGASNVAAGQKIAYAKLGAELFYGNTGEKKKLKKSKIRGVTVTLLKGFFWNEMERFS